MTCRIIPAIMSGGAGTRLWPLSTETQPKQFHALMGARSLFTETAARVCGDAGDLSFVAPIVLCGETHAGPARAALSEANVTPAAIVIEPAARNTAAVAAAAAAIAQEIAPDALVLLLPSDHLINDVAAFHAAVNRAAPFARDRIITFGMTPTRATTGYGYIKRGAELGDGVFAVDAFKEKPDAATAQAYIDAGAYSWNSGMFLFDPATLLAEFGANATIRDRALDSLKDASRSGDEIRLGAAYAHAPALPLDIAVMERTSRAAVAPCDIGWADIGSWDEIWRLSPHDNAGNAIRGRVCTLDAHNNLLRSDGARLCIAGVSDLIVVATRDAILILPRDRGQDVKLLRELAEKT